MLIVVIVTELKFLTLSYHISFLKNGPCDLMGNIKGSVVDCPKKKKGGGGGGEAGMPGVSLTYGSGWSSLMGFPEGLRPFVSHQLI